MFIFALIIVIIATSLPTSQALMQKKTFRKEAGQGSEQADEDQEMCTKYGQLNRELRDCINIDLPDEIISSFVLNGLTTMCQNKATIRQCMMDKITSCETSYDVIVRLLDTFLGFCVGSWIPGDVRNFLQANNVTLTESCAEAVLDVGSMPSPKCNLSSMPSMRLRGNLTEQTVAVDGLFWWFVNCLMTSNFTEVADAACGNITRGQAYGLGICALQLDYGLGINHYDKFEVFKVAYYGPDS